MYDKVFEDIGGFKIDARTSHRDLIFDNLGEALKHKDKFPGLSNAQSAKFADYVTIKLDDTHRIIIKRADHSAVRKEFLGDDTEYNTKIIFKTAEFHGYMHFSHLPTNTNLMAGASISTPNATEGTWIIRNDQAYDNKYYKGTATKESSKLDKASIAVEFLMTEKEALNIISEIDKEHKSIPPDNQVFKFTGNNCHDFAHKIYKLLGKDGHFIDFIRSKHLDFHDMGIFWIYKLAYPSISQYIGIMGKMLYEHPSARIPMLIKGIPYVSKFVLKAFNLCEAVYDFASWNYYYYFCSSTTELANKQDAYGNNALHKALLMGDIKAAEEYLKMEVSCNAQNVRGETALHLAAGLKPSPAKIALLEKLIEKTTNINQPDLYEDCIPLTFAVIADDREAIELLVSKGANVYFINGTNESLGNIAAETAKGKPEAAKALFEIAPDILYYDNGTRQIPIHHDNMKGILTPPEAAPPAKDHITEHNIITDVLEHFKPLIEVLTPNIILDAH